MKAASTTVNATFTATTIARYASGESGYRRLVPLTANATVTPPPAANGAAANIGWRDESYTRVGQNLQPVKFTGTWTFSLQQQLQVALADIAANFTVVVYAVSATNGTRELFRATLASVSTILVATRTITAAPGTITLAADEIVQYEFYVETTAAAVPASAADIVVFLGTDATHPNASQLDPPDAALTATAGIAEQVGPVDVVSRGINSTRAVPESAGPVGSLSATLSYARPIADAVGPVATPSSAVAYSRPVAEQVGLTDTPRMALVYPRSVTEATGPNGTVSISLAYPRAVAEAAGLVDTTRAVPRFSRTASDAVGPLDLPSVRRDSYVRGSSESVGIVATVSSSYVEGPSDSPACISASVAALSGIGVTVAPPTMIGVSVSAVTVVTASVGPCPSDCS